MDVKSTSQLGSCTGSFCTWLKVLFSNNAIHLFLPEILNGGTSEAKIKFPVKVENIIFLQLEDRDFSFQNSPKIIRWI